MSVRILIRLILVLCLLISCSDSNHGPEAKISIKVIDENNQTIDDALVEIGFLSNSDRNKELSISGKVNYQGVFTATGKTNGLVGATISKQGFYNSTVDYPFTKKSGNHWEPWNPVVTETLRKIENPVPMYARKLSPILLPEANKRIGFDLMEYDWVSPYGKGKHADFIFQLGGKYNSEYDFNNTLTLEFTNKFDGIQLVTENRRFGSQFKLPRTAPETGYQSKLIRSESRAPGQPYKSDRKEDNNYIFRIRSEEKNGKLIRAMYGKIQGDINFGVDKTHKASITFTPYLNPDYTRNLEFNPKQNLFKELKSFERVGLD